MFLFVCIFFFFFFFLILAEIEMTRNKNRLFGHHLETVQTFHFFFWNMVVISVHIHGVEIIKNSGGKMVFQGGFQVQEESTLVT